MTIFVTGGAGYIGTHVILELLEQGYAVVAADNFVNSKPSAVARIKQHSGIDFSFYEMDIRDSGRLNEIFTAHCIDCVVHLAGLKAVGESVEQPLGYYANNLDSTISLLSAMRAHEINKIVFSSSATVYSGNNEMPLTEESRIGDCINPYGWTKFMCEQILTDCARIGDGCAVALLRYFNPIGAHESGLFGEDPRDTPNNLMPFIAQTAMGKFSHLNIYGGDYETPDGTGIRDYIHVVDLALGHVAAIHYLCKHPGVSTFNLGTGRGVSVLELVTAFEQSTGISISKKIIARRPGDLAICVADVEKAKRELSWESKKSLHDACTDTWRWQSTNPNGYDS
ncbi:MAG: UDP-glucose 4-epimerase GalE [Oscillospiraceae bacterium]|nr:UDP-glucose 4-epimerase GalE [Oscillospiraceae bacterium]